MVLSLPVDLSNPQIRDVTVLGRVARRDDGVVDGSGSDDTTYPPDGVANQDNRGGRTGVCAPWASLPANAYSRLYLMDLTLEYGTVTVRRWSVVAAPTTRHIHQMALRTKTTVTDGQGYVLHGLLFLLMPTRDFISWI